MKNKLKKIIPIILSMVLILGNCLVVDAAKVSSKKLTTGDTGVSSISARYVREGEEYYIGAKTEFEIISSNDFVRILPVCYIYSRSSEFFGVGTFFVSTSNFSLKIRNNGSDVTDELCSNINLSNKNFNTVSPYSLTYNGTKYYYYDASFSGAIAWTDLDQYKLVNSSYPGIQHWDYINGDFNSDSQRGLLFEKMYLADFTWDNGLSLNYAQQPTASIEPPQNLSIYRGYSNADKQYKFQMQWDKPDDTNLNVEVMYNIHWKEGVGSALGFGTHVYKKYPHITYESGHSAQTNKLQYLEDDLLKGYFASQDMEVPAFYNIDEIYVRFAKEVDGVIQYSLWRKIDYLNLDEGNGFDATEDDFKAESSTGAFDTSDNWIDQSVQNGEIVNGSDKENAKAPGLDANGDNITNVDTPIVNPNVWDEGTIFSTFTDALQSAVDFAAGFPAMISEFFGFLPPAIIGCLSIGLLMVIILRFLGR